MIYFYKEKEAKEIWDIITLSLSNPTYYQSFNSSKINEWIEPSEYVYSKNAEGKVNIMGFVKIVDNEKFFPGYHMNKKSWITIKLDNSVDIKTIKKLIDNSYNLSLGAKAVKKQGEI